MGKRKTEINASRSEEGVANPNEKKVAKTNLAQLNRDDFEVWLVKIPESLPLDTVKKRDLSSNDLKEFECEGNSYSCETTNLPTRSLVLLQKSETSEKSFEKIDIAPVGNIVVSRDIRKTEVDLDVLTTDPGPEIISQELKQRFVPFGIIPKRKHKKKKRA